MPYLVVHGSLRISVVSSSIAWSEIVFGYVLFSKESSGDVVDLSRLVNIDERGRNHDAECTGDVLSLCLASEHGR